MDGTPISNLEVTLAEIGVTEVQFIESGMSLTRGHGLTAHLQKRSFRIVSKSAESLRTKREKGTREETNENQLSQKGGTG